MTKLDGATGNLVLRLRWLAKTLEQSNREAGRLFWTGPTEAEALKALDLIEGECRNWRERLAAERRETDPLKGPIRDALALHQRTKDDV